MTHSSPAAFTADVIAFPPILACRLMHGAGLESRPGDSPVQERTRNQTQLVAFVYQIAGQAFVQFRRLAVWTTTTGACLSRPILLMSLVT